MQFKVDQTLLSYSADVISGDEFVVSSVPHSYMVRWVEHEHPCAELNRQLELNRNQVLLIDSVVFDLYGSEIQHDPARIYQAKATELFKTPEGMLSVFEYLYTHQLTKSERLIVVGGGIMQDVGGLVSACYKRGIDWVHFPTTLLSMSDSCIGGKVGVNYRDTKNQFALFYAPQAVMMNPAFLPSLSSQEIRSGLGEVLKSCLIGGGRLLSCYMKNIQYGQYINHSSLKPLILSALAVKKAVIEQDEFEMHERKALNYGHTIGHVIESMTQYAIPHGLAVVVGMIIENELSHAQGYLSAEDKCEIKRLCLDLLDEAILRRVRTLKAHDMIAYLKQDKKTQGHQVTFVLLKAVGHVAFVPLAIDQVLMTSIAKALEELL